MSDTLSDALIHQLEERTFGKNIHSLLQDEFGLVETNLSKGSYVDDKPLERIAFALLPLKSIDLVFFNWFSRSIQLLESARRNASRTEGYVVQDLKILKATYLLMCGKHIETESEYTSLVKSLGFDREGESLKVLDAKGDDTKYLIVAVNIITLGLKLAFFSKSTNRESYTLIVRLLDELFGWFRVEDKLESELYDLASNLGKCTLLLAHRVLFLEHNLVRELHTYTLRAQDKLQVSSIEFSQDLCSILFSKDAFPHSEADQSCIHKFLVHVIESLSKLVNKENRGLELVEFMYVLTNSCKNATADLKTAIAASVKDIIACFPDVFALEKATMLYNLSWYYLQQLCQSDRTKNHNEPIQEVVLWLKQAFVLSCEDPSLLQKVSTLLSCIYVLSCSVEPFDSWLSFSKLTANQWAFYFHTRSVGCCFSSQFSSKLATKVLL